MRAILVAVALVFAAVSVGAGPAHADHQARQVRFVGIHPIPKSEGGGICYIEGPHVHIYGPDSKLHYRDHRGSNYFVGDPVAYGWDGPRTVYKGHHPIYVNAVVGDDQDDVEYCYLDGPHYHAFAPPPSSPDFRVEGDAYFYIGQPPKVYLDARPQMMRVNAIYQPLVYERPVVTVEAPVGWIGARVDLPVVVVDPAPVYVEPAGGVEIGVRVPMPSVNIQVGLPGVEIRGGGGFVIGGGGGGYRRGHDDDDHRGREHHDNGRHRGHR